MKRKKKNTLGSKSHLSLGLFVCGYINYSKEKKSGSISLIKKYISKIYLLCLLLIEISYKCFVQLCTISWCNNNSIPHYDK